MCVILNYSLNKDLSSLSDDRHQHTHQSCQQLFSIYACCRLVNPPKINVHFTSHVILLWLLGLGGWGGTQKFDCFKTIQASLATTAFIWVSLMFQTRQDIQEKDFLVNITTLYTKFTYLFLYWYQFLLEDFFFSFSAIKISGLTRSPFLLPLPLPQLI